MPMPQHAFDDETLMAFADGEVDEVTHARVSRALAEDADIAARVEMFRASRIAAGEALRPLALDPVPPGLSLSVLAMIERDREARIRSVSPPATADGSTVVTFDTGRSRRRAVPRFAPPWLMPVAAALVLMIGGSGGYFLGSRPPAQVPVEFASIADPEIIQALTEIPSGKALDVPATGRTIEPVLSFKLEDGTLCREYKLRGPDARGVVSIACLEQDSWKTHLTMAATRPEEGFMPAGSAETIDAYLASIHAGSPLDGSQEDAVLRAIRR
jgi:anti-sigma factor RsiW